MNRQPITTVERWSGIRLWVYRSSGMVAPSSLIVRRQAPTGRRDTLLARGEVPLSPGGLVSTSPLHAALAGLCGCYGDYVVGNALEDLYAEGVSVPPQGATGVDCPTP